MNTTFHVGDRVQVPFGKRKAIGVISEDRGFIGAHGRRLFQVLIAFDPFEPSAYEFPESEIEPVPQKSAVDQPLSAVKVIEYLKNGGLVAILRSNRSGGGNQPRVWLCLDQLGNVTHTFSEGRGQIGGNIVPFMAVEGERIFEPKRHEVVALLNSFDLDRTQAEDVVQAVGLFPR